MLLFVTNKFNHIFSDALSSAYLGTGLKRCRGYKSFLVVWGGWIPPGVGGGFFPRLV